MLLSHKSPDSVINATVEFGVGEGKAPLDKIVERAKQHQPAPKATYDEGEKGFLDYIADIEENSTKMTNEITSMGNEMDEMDISINAATNEINRVKSQSGNVDASFVRNICRKLSSPIDIFAGKLKGHVNEVFKYWDIVENSYLSLLDNQYAQNVNNIEGFISVLRGCLGMERRLNKAISSLISELEEYLQMTDTMSSSVDRILSKGEIVIDTLKKQSLMQL